MIKPSHSVVRMWLAAATQLLFAHELSRDRKKFTAAVTFAAPLSMLLNAISEGYRACAFNDDELAEALSANVFDPWVHFRFRYFGYHDFLMFK